MLASVSPVEMTIPPRIVQVSDNQCACIVLQPQYISLQDVDIGIHGISILAVARLAVRVEDMQVFRTADHMGNRFPGYNILGLYGIPVLGDGFTYPLSVLIVYL